MKKIKSEFKCLIGTIKLLLILRKVSQNIEWYFKELRRKRMRTIGACIAFVALADALPEYFDRENVAKMRRSAGAIIAIEGARRSYWDK